ncbi:MAG: hypothetical protein HY717_06185 [Planctomycetes bacterium]|nr:hypothetical protein [Planctomycetota bacterium]
MAAARPVPSQAVDPGPHLEADLRDARQVLKFQLKVRQGRDDLPPEGEPGEGIPFDLQEPKVNAGLAEFTEEQGVGKNRLSAVEEELEVMGVADPAAAAPGVGADALLRGEGRGELWEDGEDGVLALNPSSRSRFRAAFRRRIAGEVGLEEPL